MTDHSRRKFLKNASIGAATIGAASIGAAAVLPASADAEPAVTGPAHDGSFAVWVKDARTGELAVLVGETEVVHHDKALAQQLARIAGRGAKA